MKSFAFSFGSTSMGFVVLEYRFAQSGREADCSGRGRQSDGGGKLGEFTVLASVDFASGIVGGFATKIKTKLVAIGGGCQRR